MPTLRQPESKHGSKEDGFILLAVLFLTVLVLIALAVAAPKMARSIQRDKELELVHRGEQYKRAIKLYYKKFGAYPSSIDQLMNTNNVRFLRKRYADPITGKNDWRLIYMGQAKVPPLGFFGQPLTGLTGPANVGTPVGGATGSSFMGAPGASSSAFGASGSGASGFGSSSFGSPSSGSSAFGSSDSDSSAFGSSNPGAATTSTDGSDAGSSDASDSSDTDAGSGSSIQGGSITTSTGGTGSSAFGSSTSGSGNPTLGGGPIVGVGIPSTKASLIEYKKQKHYNQWEFVYNPIEDQMQAAANLFGGGAQNVNGTSGTGTGTGTGTGIDSSTTGTGFGSSTGSSGTGFGSSFGSGDNGSSGGTSNPPAGSNPNQQ